MGYPKSVREFNELPTLFSQEAGGELLWADLLEHLVKWGRRRVTNEKQTSSRSAEVKGEAEFVWEVVGPCRGQGWDILHVASQGHAVVNDEHFLKQGHIK